MHVKRRLYTLGVLVIASEAIGVAALIVAMAYAVPLGHALMQP